MNDQDIYKTIGRILYSESPSAESDIHMLALCRHQSVVTSLWYGEARLPESGFHLSSGASIEIASSVLSLQQYFDENKWGRWNVLHYVLLCSDSRFNVELECNIDLESGKLPFWKYCREYR